MIWKLNLGFILIYLTVCFGQECKLSSGKTGYCRDKEDCWGGSDKKGCENDFVCCSINEKSVQKCKDYGKYVFKKEYSGALSARSLMHNASQCAIEAVPLVVGGVKAKANEFPHMVAIGYGDDLKTAAWMCGGTLISENFVLTAAHCSQSQEKGPAKFVRIGVLNVKNTGRSNVQDFKISARINHPRYKPPSRYHDIALFKLSGAVKMDASSRPACLHVSPNEFTFKKATATGWGKLDYNANEGSPDLMKVALSLIDYPKCNSSFTADVGGGSLPRGIIPSQFCAGELGGGKDTCQGDSGGPIQVKAEDHYCMYNIIGVTSFGKFCGFKNSPAVYTRVSYYVPWIESVVWH